MPTFYYLLLDSQDLLCGEVRERSVVGFDDALEGEVEVLAEAFEEDADLDVVLDVVVAGVLELRGWVGRWVRVSRAYERTSASMASSFLAPLPAWGEEYRRPA